MNVDKSCAQIAIILQCSPMAAAAAIEREKRHGGVASIWRNLQHQYGVRAVLAQHALRGNAGEYRGMAGSVSGDQPRCASKWRQHGVMAWQNGVAAAKAA